MFVLKNKIFNIKEKGEKSWSDCKWYTFKKGEIIPNHLIELAKQQGAEFEETKSKVNLDLNNDGVVDDKDASIASTVLNEIKKKKRGRPKKTGLN